MVEIRRFSNTRFTLESVKLNSVAYLIADLLDNGLELKYNQKRWLMEASVSGGTHGGYAGPTRIYFHVHGYEISFTNLLKRFVFRMAGEYAFRYIWSTDLESVQRYIHEELEESEQATLAELYELPNTYEE